MDQSARVYCSNCEADLGPPPRPEGQPCPSCGGDRQTIHLQVHETLGVTDEPDHFRDLIMNPRETDRGTEYCGNEERHEYELYLALNDIDHTKTKAKSPQTNGICERFHKTQLDEFYRIAFRKKIYRSLVELQTDLSTNTTHDARIRASVAKGELRMRH